MHFPIQLRLIALLWLGWLVYWAISAISVKPVQRRESPASRWSYGAVTALGGVLLTLHMPRNPLTQSFLPPDLWPFVAWVGVALVVLGLGFAIWARRYLGGNWSGAVVLKENHELIRGGPYGWVRHPIYAGILLALTGVAITEARVAGLAAVVLFTAGFVRKLRLEEAWLAEIFPDYADYRASVPALIPLIY
jgi:protein-S-isoprenylcysteine O-methyltransferase Ste14